MGRGKKGIDTKGVLFKRLNGVKAETFNKMLDILNREYNQLHKNGGKPPKLTPEDKLRITLKYLRQYPTMDSLAEEYKVCKGTISLSIQWVEDTLANDGTFALPGKRALKRKSASIEYIVVDVTESPINRPQKGQQEYYSGKKSAIH
jgi:transposase-like protein